MSFVPEIEYQSPPVIRAFQEEKLRELISYVSLHSPFYRKHFATHGIDPASIRMLKDLAAVPAVTKEDIQQHNWDFLCVPRAEIVEYTSTSGTLGKPVTIALTAQDLKRLAYNEYISFACADGSSKDLYQLMLTLDRQFMAGIAYYEGIRKLGAGIVRVGPGLPAMQWETIERLKPTVLVAVPSFLVKLVAYAEEKGIDLNASSVKRAICIGENLRTNDLGLSTIGKRIAASWSIQLYSTYASTEMQTAFTECTHGRGGHHHPELIIVEILDDAGQPVPEGQVGEVTITTLGVQGMPLLRYQTGDMAFLMSDDCACGRKTCRISPVVGRKRQMIKIKGTTLYPPAIIDVIHRIENITDFAVEAFTGALDTDEIRIHLLVGDDHRSKIAASLAQAFQSFLRVSPEIYFTTASQLEQLHAGKSDRKINRFVDSRKTG